MPRFQFEIAVALAVSSLFSLIVFYFTRETDGKIQLPVVDNLDEESPDPFDVTKVEDIIDGYPIDETAFWNRVRFE